MRPAKPTLVALCHFCCGPAGTHCLHAERVALFNPELPDSMFAGSILADPVASRTCLCLLASNHYLRLGSALTLF
jgi:hypothetical protein